MEPQKISVLRFVDVFFLEKRCLFQVVHYQVIFFRGVFMYSCSGSEGQFIKKIDIIHDESIK